VAIGNAARLVFPGSHSIVIETESKAHAKAAVPKPRGALAWECGDKLRLLHCRKSHPHGLASKSVIFMTHVISCLTL